MRTQIKGCNTDSKLIRSLLNLQNQRKIRMHARGVVLKEGGEGGDVRDTQAPGTSNTYDTISVG